MKRKLTPVRTEAELREIVAADNGWDFDEDDGIEPGIFPWLAIRKPQATEALLGIDGWDGTPYETFEPLARRWLDLTAPYATTGDYGAVDDYLWMRKWTADPDAPVTAWCGLVNRLHTDGHSIHDHPTGLRQNLASRVVEATAGGTPFGDDRAVVALAQATATNVAFPYWEPNSGRFGRFPHRVQGDRHEAARTCVNDAIVSGTGPHAIPALALLIGEDRMTSAVTRVWGSYRSDVK